jgi:hypothetical protein
MAQEVKNKGWRVTFSGTAINLALGILYTWSIFKDYFKDQLNKWKYNVGGGIDDPRNDQLSTGMRSRNTFYFGNLYYNLIPPVNLCVEYSRWETDYIRKADGINNRIQTSVIYSW